MAFGGMTTSCSASNLGTLTRIPSTEQQHNMSGNMLASSISVEDYTCGTLTRIPYADMHSGSATNTIARTPSSDEYDTGTLTRIPTIDQYNGGIILSRMSSNDQYPTMTLGEFDQKRGLNRIPSIDQNVGTTRTEFGTLQRIPSEQHIGTLTRIQTDQPNLGTLTRTEQLNTLNRIPSEYQNPNSLRDPNMR